MLFILYVERCVRLCVRVHAHVCSIAHDGQRHGTPLGLEWQVFVSSLHQSSARAVWESNHWAITSVSIPLNHLYHGIVRFSVIKLQDPNTCVNPQLQSTLFISVPISSEADCNDRQTGSVTQSYHNTSAWISKHTHSFWKNSGSPKTTTS